MRLQEELPEEAKTYLIDKRQKFDGQTIYWLDNDVNTLTKLLGVPN